MTCVMQKIHRSVLEHDETSTRAGGDDRSSEVREPIPPPWTKVAMEATLEKASLVEGMCTEQLIDTKHSRRGCRI
jgi:hypothetical protein